MSDSRQGGSAAFDRISIRAVLVREGEDPGAALAEAGFVDAVAIPVVMGDATGLEGGILGDGITPNLVAVLETEPDDGFESVRNVQPGLVRPEGTAAPPAPVTVNLPSAFGSQPLAPVRRPGG